MTFLVVGDVICDTYVVGDVSGISPEAPVPVLASVDERRCLGGAANVAANLRALGCEVCLVGVVGDDVAGRYVRERLRVQGIAELLLRDAGRPTTEKTRIMARHQQVVRLDRESRRPMPAELIAQALARTNSVLPEVDGLICSDYDKGVCTPGLLDPLFERAKAAALPIFVDPKARDFARYRGATVLTPNLAEVGHATRDRPEPESLASAAERLLRRSEAQALLVTRGEAGMSLFRPAEVPHHLPAHARDVVDVTGAGDTVIAAFAAAAVGGLSYAEAAWLANVAASIAVGKAGTAVVCRDELEAQAQVARTDAAERRASAGDGSGSPG
ncbi:MAG: D-glycero-beta-D-manno-heptose-7-phosphate kinase [Gemmatimonadota bacterium]|nr:D-glycero-beta-D-manno-heptose-7-phosphate kinase [Gemmatimonadota bacterium]